MIQQTDRITYWQQLCESHILVAHNADIMEGSVVVDQRKSFVADIADELEASEILKLHFPCVVANLVEGKIILRDDQQRFRYQNKLSFLNRFSIDSDADPCIPRSKESAFNITYNVMMDYLKKLLEDFAANGACGYFKYIDENSIRWEAVELAGSNMCGWDFFFNDEESVNFNLSDNSGGNWEDPGTGNETAATNQTEIIYFGTETEIAIPWTDERKEMFGAFPLVQIWKFVEGKAQLVTVVVTADNAPEEFTYLTIETPGTPGFAVIK